MIIRDVYDMNVTEYSEMFECVSCNTKQSYVYTAVFPKLNCIDCDGELNMLMSDADKKVLKAMMEFTCRRCGDDHIRVTEDGLHLECGMCYSSYLISDMRKTLVTVKLPWYKRLFKKEKV